MTRVQEVFPHKTDFPNRHIGPRKTEVVAMLDYIGFKVSAKWNFPLDKISSRNFNFIFKKQQFYRSLLPYFNSRWTN